MRLSRRAQNVNVCTLDPVVRADVAVLADSQAPGERKATRARIHRGETTRGASEEPDNRFRSVQHARNINGTETVGRVTVRNLYTSIRVISSDSISSRRGSV